MEGSAWWAQESARPITPVGDRGNYLVWGHRFGRVPCRSNGAALTRLPAKGISLFSTLAYPRPGDTREQQVWVLVLECTELAAVWYSGKNSGPS